MLKTGCTYHHLQVQASCALLEVNFALPMVVTVWSSVEKFQALAMRLAARVLLAGTGFVAFLELVCLMMDLSGKSFCQGDPWLFLTSIT